MSQMLNTAGRRRVYVEAARDYARLWQSKERHFVARFGSTDNSVRLAALRDAAGYFRIARSFALRHDVQRGLERLQPAMEALDRVLPPRLSRHRAPLVLQTLRHELGRPYGGKDLLSAASKFAWMRHPDAVIIYDSQVWASLGTPYGDYGTYLELWQAEYARAEGAIADACLRIKAGNSDAIDGKIVAQDWFRRRVLDIALWRAGRRNGSPSS